MTQSELEQQSQGKGKTVKRVTNVDVIRRAQGTYELELTLDGTVDFVLSVEASEVSTVLRNFQHSDSVLFDTEKQDLVFEHYH